MKKKCLDIIYGAKKRRKEKKVKVDQKLIAVRAVKVKEIPQTSAEKGISRFIFQLSVIDMNPINSLFLMEF
jgi:hypothetical protein